MGYGTLMLELSVVVPMHNEAGGADALVREIARECAGLDHEIIAVDDASTDGTLEALRAAKADLPQLRVLAHATNAGQCRAVQTGVVAARAPVVATLDGDGQNPPGDIPALVEALRADPALGLVGGVRQKRQDSAAKLAASRAGNAVRKRLLRDDADDTGCGLKAFRRDVFLRLPYFDHMHRYLPALVKRDGWDTAFLPVSHRAREHGVSKYTNLGRLVVSVRDLRGVRWLQERGRLPGEVREL